MIMKLPSSIFLLLLLVFQCYHALVLPLQELSDELLPRETSDGKPEMFADDPPPEELVAMDMISKVNQEKHLNLLYEGDINLLGMSGADNSNTLFQQNSLNNPFSNKKVKRETVRDRRLLWHNRVVPYVITDALANEAKAIEAAMQHIATESCIKFKVRTNEQYFIRFVKEDGCWSAVGKVYYITGGQDVSLGTGCYESGTIVHEILHALGFWHEQSRADRDHHVEIFWENIRKDQEYNFNKQSHSDVSSLGVQYDPASVMHYGRYSFSKNSKPTILAIGDPKKKLGQKYGLSALDVVQLNALYDCANVGKSHWSSWSDFGPCSSYCYKTRQRFCTSSDANHCQGANQFGVQSETVKCKKDATECYAPVDGHWGRWSSWGSCSVTCAVGVQTRSRQCEDPKPKFNGKACVGEGEQSQACSMGSCDLGPDDCQFEIESKPFCQWSNMESSAQLKWERRKGPTTTGNTGPSGDHTTGSGYYIYMEASAPAKSRDRALLSSRLLTTQGPQCLTFYYHMYGQTMGALRVFVQETSTNSISVLYTKLYDQGNKWHEAKITIDKEAPYRIIIEGIKGYAYLSDIALDDISLKAGSCKNADVAPTLAPSIKPRPTVMLPPERVGCYKDDGVKKGRRPFPNYTDLRSSIDWKKIEKVVQDCSRIAREKGCKYFAIQFYGECWYGNTQEVNYARDGTTDNCWKSVGKAKTMMVYKLKSRGKKYQEQ